MVIHLWGNEVWNQLWTESFCMNSAQTPEVYFWKAYEWEMVFETLRSILKVFGDEVLELWYLKRWMRELIGDDDVCWTLSLWNKRHSHSPSSQVSTVHKNCETMKWMEKDHFSPDIIISIDAGDICKIEWQASIGKWMGKKSSESE